MIEQEKGMCVPQRRSVSSDVLHIKDGITRAETIITEIMFRIDGNGISVENKPTKEPNCISETLEQMIAQTERIVIKLMQINDMV